MFGIGAICGAASGLCCVFSSVFRCCQSASQCGMRFNRIFYIFMLLIPIICNIIFMFNESYFVVKFTSYFKAFSDPNFSPVWALNIRFVFTYFIYHCILLAFSLFALCDSLVGVAKVMHRGLLFIKLPFLAGFLILTFIFPNKALENFQYLAIFLGSVYQFFLCFVLVELTYVGFDGLRDAPKFVRILLFVLLIAFYGLGIASFAFTFLKSDSDTIQVLTAILIATWGLTILFSIIAKHSSSMPVCIAFLIYAASTVYSANWNFASTFKHQFNNDCYYAFASILSIFSFLGCFIFTVTEISLIPMFKGTISQNQMFGEMVSTIEDEDPKSSKTSYYYWAFHLVMMGAVCFLNNLTVYTTTKQMKLEHWYLNGIGGIILGALLLWTEVFPMCAKDRAFW
ncbi:Serine_incorporator protein [Hexamita inflata]|uniref:Serine_incorporator protein n=1 Tax=Hexamita inflata TaxID=28002 RepID=A0ABP1GH35_9EUKA